MSHQPSAHLPSLGDLLPVRYLQVRYGEKRAFVEVSKEHEDGTVSGFRVNRDGSRYETPIPGVPSDEGYRTHLFLVAPCDIIAEYRMSKRYAVLVRFEA